MRPCRICPDCKRAVAIQTNGTFYPHRDRNSGVQDDGHRRRCAWSGLQPPDEHDSLPEPQLERAPVPLGVLRQAWRNGWTDRGNAMRQTVTDANQERAAYERAFVRYMSEDPAEDDKDPYRPLDGPNDPAAYGAEPEQPKREIALAALDAVTRFADTWRDGDITDQRTVSYRALGSDSNAAVLTEPQLRAVLNEREQLAARVAELEGVHDWLRKIVTDEHSRRSQQLDNAEEMTR
jgi:hypothetical protein